MFLLSSFFSFSQEKITVIDFLSGDYPIGENVKILYDKDWKPVNEIDSADFYREITFKEKNIPQGRITDYYISGIKQNIFYASFVGLNSKGVDSVFKEGQIRYFYENGKISMSEN